MRLVSLAVAIWACVAASSSRAAVVRGHVFIEKPVPLVTVPVPKGTPAACGPLAVDDEILTNDKGALQNVVVRVAGAFPQDVEGPLAPVRLEQRQCRFAPRVVVMREGAPLLLESADPLPHPLTAKADSDGALFEFLLEPRHQATAMLELGVLRMRCSAHPWARASIVVVDTQLVALTGSDGGFTIAGVPPGPQRLVLWHEALGTMEVGVDVTDGATTDLTLRLRSRG